MAYDAIEGWVAVAEANGIAYPPLKISKKAEQRYLRISKDIQEGKNVTSAESVDELLKLLNS